MVRVPLIRCVVAALALAPLWAEAGGQTTSFWVEERSVFAGGHAPQIDGVISHAYSQKLGAYGFFQVGKEYAQAYFGPTISPRPWLQVGMGLGMEQAENPWRFGSFLWAGNECFSLLGVVERGGGGTWYESHLNLPLLRGFGLGATAYRFAGFGPRAEISAKIGGTPLMFWGAFLKQPGGAGLNGLAGARVSF